MNRKMLPVLFMLISGVITCIATFVHEYSMLEKLIILLLVMIFFGVLGSILQRTLDYFDRQNEKTLEEAAENEQEEVQVQDKQENESAKK